MFVVHNNLFALAKRAFRRLFKNHKTAKKQQQQNNNIKQNKKKIKKN